MFDLGSSEMLIIGVVALLVIGPKDLPKVIKQVGQWIRYMRGMASEFQSGVDDMVREADLEDAKKALDVGRDLNPRRQIQKLIDPENDLDKSLDFESDLSETGVDYSSGYEDELAGEDMDGEIFKSKFEPQKASSESFLNFGEKTGDNPDEGSTDSDEPVARTTAKKLAAKKAAPKKPAAKKAPVKKATAKKPAAKKAAPKKTVAKKPAPKKAPAKTGTKAG